MPASASWLCTPPTTRTPLLPSWPATSRLAAWPWPTTRAVPSVKLKSWLAGSRPGVTVGGATGAAVCTPTSRTMVLPLLSVATMCTTSVPDDTVSVRCARTVFTSDSEPLKLSVVPLVAPKKLPRPSMPSVPPPSEVSVTL